MAKSLDIIDPKRDLRSEEEDEEPIVPEEREQKEGSGSLFFLILGVIAVLVSISLALYILLKDKDSNKSSGLIVQSVVPSPIPSETVSPQMSAVVSVSPSVSTSSIASTFKYTDESIRIANGNNTNGEAARIKKILEARGYKIESTGNASKQYPATIIYYAEGQEKMAEALKSDIASEYKATIEKADSTILGNYDAVIALGAN